MKKIFAVSALLLVIAAFQPSVYNEARPASTPTRQTVKPKIEHPAQQDLTTDVKEVDTALIELNNTL